MNEYRVGDKIRVTDVRDATVVGVDNAGYVYVDDQEYLNPKCAHKLKWTRTIEVVERAPVPWQAGDIARHPVTGNPVIRQADEVWINTMGQTTALTDGDIGTFKPIVRGGKRVTG